MDFHKDKIRLNLSLASSILNHAGYKCLLNYLSLETYKKVVKDEYVCFDKIKSFSFIEDENTWIHFMEKLVELKLAVKNGNYYITKSKLNSWKSFANENQKTCMKFNGFLHFDMPTLYKLKKEEDLKDLIYLSVIRVISSKSTSRRFRKELTGISPNLQKQIEKRQSGKNVEIIEHHIPVDCLEIKNDKVGEIPVFNGVVSTKHMKCVKTSGRLSNCKVIQLGNKLKIKDLNICGFEYPKNQFQKTKSNLDNLNNSSKKGEEVKDWDSFDMVIDSSENAKTNKMRGIASMNDTRYITWKDFKSYDYCTIKTISGSGVIGDLRQMLNEK